MGAREQPLTEQQRRERIARPQAQRILAAARRLLGERGAAGATFEAITSEAEVGRGSVVYFFGSKEGMLVELLHVEAEQRLRRVEQRLAPAATLDELLDAMGAELAAHLPPPRQRPGPV